MDRPNPVSASGPVCNLGRRNLSKARRTGRRPVCDIEIGHRSTTMALLGMLALKVDRAVTWDAAKQEILADPAANALLSREYRGPWTYPWQG